LLIIDPEAIPFEKIQELLEWSPLVMVSEKAVGKVLDWGIKIDVLLTAKDNEASRQIAMDQSPMQVLISSLENNFAAACEFLMKRKQSNLNVVIADVTTHLIFVSTQLARINIVLFDGEVRWHFVSDGSYSKWVPAQTSVLTFINGNIEKINVEQTGIFKIERKESFWVGESF